MSGILKTALAATCVAVAMTVGVVHADEIPMVTGLHWTQSSEPAKKAYLIGIANVVQLETAYSAGSPLPDAQTTLPRFVRGLKGHTLDSVRQSVDAWYAAHPDRMQRPVIETIWFELVVPGLEKNR